MTVCGKKIGPWVSAEVMTAPEQSEEDRNEGSPRSKVSRFSNYCSLFSFNGLTIPDGVVRISDCPPVLAKTKNSGPPDHAKAHGYRAKHTYRYYPEAQAYYDVERKAYFYLEGGNWQVSVSLPISLKAKLGDYVTIGMDSDKPYTQFEEHRTSYPPGQMKKKH